MFVTTTTTIRVDRETHERLLRLSEQRGESLMATVREAADALRRQQFAMQTADELAVLAQDTDAWAAYVAGADAALGDGIA